MLLLFQVVQKQCDKSTGTAKTRLGLCCPLVSFKTHFNILAGFNLKFLMDNNLAFKMLGEGEVNPILSIGALKITSTGDKNIISFLCLAFFVRIFLLFF